MDEQARNDLIVLIPVVLFLTVALVGVMIVSAYYVDSKGIISIRPDVEPAYEDLSSDPE
jgi:hypothetical protein